VCQISDDSSILLRNAYVYVLLGNYEQKNNRRQAAQHPRTNTSQTWSGPEEAVEQDEDCRQRRVTSAKCPGSSPDQTSMDDAQRHCARFRQCSSCRQFHDVFAAVAAEIVFVQI